jgi:hypothetical protein
MAVRRHQGLAHLVERGPLRLGRLDGLLDRPNPCAGAALPAPAHLDPVGAPGCRREHRLKQIAHAMGPKPIRRAGRQECVIEEIVGRIGPMERSVPTRHDGRSGRATALVRLRGAGRGCSRAPRALIRSRSADRRHQIVRNLGTGPHPRQRRRGRGCGDGHRRRRAPRGPHDRRLAAAENSLAGLARFPGERRPGRPVEGRGDVGRGPDKIGGAGTTTQDAERGRDDVQHGTGEIAALRACGLRHCCQRHQQADDEGPLPHPCPPGPGPSRQRAGLDPRSSISPGLAHPRARRGPQQGQRQQAQRLQLSLCPPRVSQRIVPLAPAAV